MNVLRRISLSRLLLIGGLMVVLGVATSALASAVSAGGVPPPKPLALAIHDALEGGTSAQGITANVVWTNHLLEGANLASSGSDAGRLASSPLLAGASGRMWISGARMRLELQSGQGDTQVYYVGHTLSIYDAASNTLYRYTPPTQQAADETAPASSASESNEVHGAANEVPAVSNEVPTVAAIEERIAHLDTHLSVSGAIPTAVAGQAAYTVHVSPTETGSLLAGAELSFDAAQGAPLRAAIYSTESSAPALELAATGISYGPVEQSVFEFTPPANSKVQELAALGTQGAESGAATDGGERPKLSSRGSGLSTIGVLESKAPGGGQQPGPPSEGLQQVEIDGTSASELPTELGTLLTFERSGVRFLIAGAVPPSVVEADAKGL